MIDYSGKTALVTGAASGIGLALAKALAARGARLVLVDQDASGLVDAAAEIGGSVRTIRTDLTDPAVPAQVVGEAFAAGGTIDLLCSNAGIIHSRKVLDEPLEAGGGRMFAVNLFASIRFAQAYAQALGSAGAQGRMLVTCSEQSLSLPPPVRQLGFGMYGASKHALLIALEWIREEIRDDMPFHLHALMPGPVPTNIAKQVEKPAGMPIALTYISPDRCAQIALHGMDLGLFYIPTHAAIADDMQARYDGVRAAIAQLRLD